MQEEKYINNLLLVPMLSSDSMSVLSYDFQKIRKTNRKADSMISERTYEKSYIAGKDQEAPTTTKGRRKVDSKERKRVEAEQKKVEATQDNRPWYQRYFWVLAIGGMIGYNILTFDKQKLKEAMEAANQQQNAGGQQRR